MMNMELSRLMNAYRGQEDKLRQRVQLSNDLLELIAYEQLTREKRKLMAEKQAQAMPPGGLPTLRDQKEKEAFDLTKQELASQIGETIQQQDAQRRQAMMRSGLPAAPGAQNVMPEQAMAAGGIVAFQTGDVVSSPQTIAEQIADLYRQGKGFGDIEKQIVGPEPSGSPRTSSGAITPEYRDYDRRLREYRAAMPEAQKLLREQPRTSRAAPVAPEAAKPQVVGAALGPEPSATQAIAAAGTRAGGAEVLTPDMMLPPKPEAAPQVDRSPIQTNVDPREVQAGIGALQAGQPSATNLLLGDMLRNRIAGSLGEADQAAPTPAGLAELAKLRADIQRYGTEFPTISPEIRAARERDLAKIEEAYARASDPEKQRLDRLQAGLLGAAGRRGLGSVLGGYGQAAMQAGAAQEAAGLQALKEIQTGREALRLQDIEQQRQAYQAKGKGLELGSKIAEVESKIQSEIGIANQRIRTELANTLVRSAVQHSGDVDKIRADLAQQAVKLQLNLSDKALDRMTQIAVAEIGAGARGAVGQSKELSDLTLRFTQEQSKILKEKNDELKDNIMLSAAMRVPPEKRTPAQKQQIEAFEKKYEAQFTRVLGSILPRLNELRSQQGLEPFSASSAPSSAADAGVRVTGAAAPRQ